MISARKTLWVSITSTAVIFYMFLVFNSKDSHYRTIFYPKYRVISQNDFNINSNKSHTNIDENNFVKKYRIETNGCKISDLPLFDEQIKRFFENKSETIWKCKPKAINIHRINGIALKFEWTELRFKPFCYYRQLSRGADDFHQVYGEFNGPVIDSVLNLPNFEFVHIICKKSLPNLRFLKFTFKTDPDIIHNEIIPLIPMINKTSPESSAPNVLLLALDSTSYINFKRHFTRTERILNKHKFFELRGYTKVGENTFPNMMPFLTGHQFDELATDEELLKMNFDDWPLIWRKYADKGFVTAFVEEMPTYGLFQYNRKGFKYKPTDYYTRPFQLELEKDTNNKFCYKNKAEFEIVLDWTYDFIKAMNERQQKYFAYISISEMTHDWLNAGHYMDVPFSEFFTKFLNLDIINDTLVLFFSDHGLRTGEFRKTSSGEIENRLPFMFIHLPENTDQVFIDNYKQNQYRLTTPYDIHATLTHYIEGTANNTLPHGLSLINDVISDNRDCDMAAIPELFCACYDETQVFDSKVIIPENTAPKIVQKINYLTEKYRSKCAAFKFRAINAIYKRTLPSKSERGETESLQSFIIQLYFTPGMALFETVIKSNAESTGFEIIGEISRINTYGYQSHCITEKKLKNYCFCNDLL